MYLSDSDFQLGFPRPNQRPKGRTQFQATQQKGSPTRRHQFKSHFIISRPNRSSELKTMLDSHWRKEKLSSTTLCQTRSSDTEEPTDLLLPSTMSWVQIIYALLIGKIINYAIFITRKYVWVVKWGAVGAYLLITRIRSTFF